MYVSLCISAHIYSFRSTSTKETDSKGPSTQIIAGFRGPKTTQSMDFGTLKPYYSGTRTLWDSVPRY